jgi:hypothetical protein
MAENVQRNKGRPSQYKFDRGGQPTEFGPYIGTVVNNIDPTRSGRLQVYIEEFGATNKDGSPNDTDKSLWRTVNYCPPYYGTTPLPDTGGDTQDYGQYPGNYNSYGMWFVPPDLGVRVLCFFVAGDPTQGYYVGCVPEQGINQMIPAIGAVPAAQRETQNSSQSTYFSNSPLTPVTEINKYNTQVVDNPQFYKQKKPVHSYVASILFQQGLIDDPVRGSIASSSQRESPSQCYGISTPGRYIYSGGYTDKQIKQEVQNDTQTSDVTIIGRRGGHTFVMDDGDVSGKNNMVRIRTAQGHQITMSDDNNCFYFIHGNGQTWLEFGQEGTVDVFSTNSVNVRTQGTINLHSDGDININAGGKLSMRGMKGTFLQSEMDINIAAKQGLNMYGQSKIGIKSDGSLGIKSASGTWDSGSSMNLTSGKINLNGGSSRDVPTPPGLTEYEMPDVTFDNSTGWQVEQNKIKSIATRAPTHEPYPYHNQGVEANIKLSEGQPTQPPGAPSVQSGWSITKT